MQVHVSRNFIAITPSQVWAWSPERAAIGVSVYRWKTICEAGEIMLICALHKKEVHGVNGLH